MTQENTTVSSCCKPAAPTEASAAPIVDERSPEEDATTCPVMVGNAVSKQAAVRAGLFRDFEGERYYFCCAGCGPAFDSDPAKYAANMAA